LQWKIEKFFEWAARFTPGVSEDSPVFEMPLGNLRKPYRFYLRIHPKGLADLPQYEGHISIQLVNEDDDKLCIEYQIYVEESSGEYLEVEGRGNAKRPFEGRNIWGYPNAVKLSDLEQYSNRYTPHGTLTIGVKITVQIPENVSTSKFSDAILEQNVDSQKTIADMFTDNFDSTVHENEVNYEKFSDFTIICEENKVRKEFKCHKIFLSSRSSVFNAMFSHQTTESSDNQVVINDVGPNTMKKLLHFIYTDTIKEDMVDVELWKAADKYEIHRLKAFCERYLAARLTTDNAVERAVGAYLHGSKTFEKQVVRFMAQNWHKIRNSENWEQVKQYPDLLCDILSNVVPITIGKRNISSEESDELDDKRPKNEIE